MDQGINIICGDALAEMKRLPAESVDLVVTDPPYNLEKDYGNGSDKRSYGEYMDFTRAWVAEAHRLLKPTGSIYVCMGMRFVAYLFAIMEERGFAFNSWITWYYTQGIGKTRGFSPRHDDILFFTKHPKDFTFNLDAVRVPQKFYRKVNNMRGANPGNVWEFSHVHYCNANRQTHPTQKPEALFERMILASSNEGEVVLDPFCGSGTAARVCQQTNRRCIGIEINPEYVEMTRNRLQTAFAGFDSIDERMRRIPQDLNDAAVREQYLQNHAAWFLANHPEERQQLMNGTAPQPDLFNLQLMNLQNNT